MVLAESCVLPSSVGCHPPAARKENDDPRTIPIDRCFPKRNATPIRTFLHFGVATSDVAGVGVPGNVAETSLDGILLTVIVPEVSTAST